MRVELIVFMQKSASLISAMQILMLVSNIISKLCGRFELIIIAKCYYHIAHMWVKFQLLATKSKYQNFIIPHMNRIPMCGR